MTGGGIHRFTNRQVIWFVRVWGSVKITCFQSIPTKIIQNYHIQSGQISATSHDLTPNGGLVREVPLFQKNLGWCNIVIWPDTVQTTNHHSHLQSVSFSPVFLLAQKCILQPSKVVLHCTSFISTTACFSRTGRWYLWEASECTC